ncbi:MAG: hypothetical protein R2911_38545 [Caldilineaceae bacterium]
MLRKIVDSMLTAILVTPLLTACIMQPGALPKPDELPAEEAAQVAADAAAQGLTAEQLLILDGLRNNGPAPELTNEVWLNTEALGGGPLQLADLRGQVTIVEFWTYG